MDMPILPGNLGDLPLLGFGLWRVPAASLALEAAILLGGVFLYWRTARSAAVPKRRGITPTVVSAVMLGCGIVVLVLDALGI
jgi:hypothetical protein